MNSSVPYLLAILGKGVVSPSTMVCHADDLGLVRGDGVFDTTRIVTAQDGTSRIDHLDEHLSRFARSIAGVNGPTPIWTPGTTSSKKRHAPGVSPAKLPSNSSTPMVVRSSPDRLEVFSSSLPFPKLQSKNGRESTCCVYPVGSLATPSPMLPGSSVGSRPCPMPSTSQLCAMPDPRAPTTPSSPLPTVTCSKDQPLG